MSKKILFVVTSHDKKGNTGDPTGFYLSKVSRLTAAGYKIDFVRPERTRSRCELNERSKQSMPE